MFVIQSGFRLIEICLLFYETIILLQRKNDGSKSQMWFKKEDLPPNDHWHCCLHPPLCNSRRRRCQVYVIRFRVGGGGLRAGDEGAILSLSGVTLDQRTPLRVAHRRPEGTRLPELTRVGFS